jgi:hypothetical protein
MSIKRLHYFNHQFLEEQDFLDEQQYHLEMRRRLNRSLHIFGVVEGLQVARSGNREVTVEPGFALDREGRELVIAKQVSRDIAHSERHRRLQVMLSYKERFEEPDRRNNGGVEGYNRVTEFAEVGITHEAEKFESGVVLGTVQLDDEGNIRHVDNDVRQLAGSLLAPRSVHTRHLADDSVTDQKLAPGLRKSLGQEFQLPDGSVTLEKLSPDLQSVMGAGARGWVRLPFKPHHLRPKGHHVRPDEGEFSVDVAFAHCDGRGARGSMGIPIPPGAKAIRDFRIAGVLRGKGIQVQLYRTGWNMADKKGEATKILEDRWFHSDFDKVFPVPEENGRLDEFHALSVAVFAEGESEIWLVAARFQ